MKVSELFEAKERTVLSVMGKQPDHIDEDFFCNVNRLTSLEGAPSSVSGDFICSYNNLTSLKGAASTVGEDFSCTSNKLTSLEGGPTKVGGDYFCSKNKITSLEGVASSIGGDFYCTRNRLTSLHNIHKQIKHIGGHAEFQQNPIKTHVLGLLLIDGLTEVLLDKRYVEDIINKHLKGDRDVFACQEELIEAGFEDFAKL